MELRGKNVLIISPEPWNHIHVSKHHYAIELAELGNHVYFLNPPNSNYHIEESEYSNLMVINYPGFLPGLYKMPRFFRIINQRFVLNKILHLANVKFDLVWSFDNSVFYDFEVFGKNTFKISHIVDLGQDFQTQKAAKSANLCLGVIPEIVSRLELYNSNTHLMRHGVKISKCKETVQLPGDNEFKALYFGNMSMPDLNWDLMKQATDQNLDVDFIFIGAHSEVVESKLVGKKNVFSIGPVASEYLSCFMDAVDVLLLFYKFSYFQKYASPHKMMEYLSSGKPIVAPYMNDYEEIRHLLMMSHDDDHWLQNLRKLVLNYKSLQTNEDSRLRILFAKEHSYMYQIERIQKIIAVG